MTLVSDCIPFDGQESRWRAKAAELCWLDLGLDRATLEWPTATCGTLLCLNLSHLAWESPKKLAYPEGVCVYCGLSAYTRDHLLPRSWTGESVRRNVLTVPACGECNSSINDRYVPSITARRRLAQECIAKKGKKLLGMRQWTPDEIAELGPTLRSFVEKGLFDRNKLLARLAWPEDPDYDLRAIQLAGISNPHELGLLDYEYKGEVTAMTALKPGWTVHGACGQSWCGVKTSHCSGCHRTFTAPSSFDRHRRRGKCLTPASAGLVLTTREYECYGLPGKKEEE